MSVRGDEEGTRGEYVEKKDNGIKEIVAQRK
jgi:hypothetical protein